MGPFLSTILAAFLSVFAVGSDPLPVRIGRPVAILGALAVILVARATAHAYLAEQAEEEEGRRVGRHPPWARALDLALFATVLWGTDWPLVAREAVADLPFLRHAFVFLPHLLASIARTDAAYPLETRDVENPWSRPRNLFFHARLLLIPVLPLFLIHGLTDAVERVPVMQSLIAAYPQATYLEALVMVGLTVGATPLIMQWLLGSQPLADGPLRDQLESYLKRVGFKVGRIDWVDTGGHVANAAFVGVLPGFNRVFISDALLRALPPDEVGAVFAHEIGHGFHRHLRTFLLFFLAVPLFLFAGMDPLAAVLAKATRAVAGTAGGDQLVGQVAGLIAVGFGAAASLGAMAFAFVWMSRRMEVEADLFAARTLDDPEVFNRALVRVGVMSGRPPHEDGLRHFAIAKRVAIVRDWVAFPEQRTYWARSLGRIRRWTLIGFGLAVVAAAATLPRDFTLVRARTLVASLDAALIKGEFDAAREMRAALDELKPTDDPIDAFNRIHLGAELYVTEDDPARAREAVAADVAAHARLQAAVDAHTIAVDPANWLIITAEIAFMQAIVNHPGAAPLTFDPDAFAAHRAWAILRGMRSDYDERFEIRRALDGLADEQAWRLLAMKKALGGRSAEELLMERYLGATPR